MFFNISCVLLIVLGIYSIVLVSIDEYKHNKELKKEQVKDDEKNECNKIGFRKDKEAITYLLLAGLCLICIYTSKLSNLFLPIFSKVYYGNLNGMFLAVASILIWVFELVAINYLAKNIFKIKLFSKSNKETKSPNLLNILLIFLLAFIPIMIISYQLGWNLKIVDDFGKKIESIKVTSVISQYAMYLVKILWTTIIIRLVQEAMERIVVTKYKIPWGGIVLMLTFGIIELFFINEKFKLMYFAFNFIFGLFYLLSNKRFSTTYWVSYLLYLL